MNDEVIDANEGWLQPSSLGSDYMRHEQAMLKCGQVPIYMAFKIEGDYNFELLKDIATNYKPRNIVVIKHDSHSFEIRRLATNANVSVFYKTMNGVTAVSEEKPRSIEQQQAIMSAIEDYKTQDISKVETYDQLAVKARPLGYVTYSYLQRRLGSVRTFRTDPRGSTTALKETLLELTEAGELFKIDNDSVTKYLNTNAIMYSTSSGEE